MIIGSEKTEKTKKSRKIYIIIAVLAVITAHILWSNLSIEYSRQSVSGIKIPADFAGFKIAHISDVHTRQLPKSFFARLCAEKPDIIAITGDLIDYKKADTAFISDFIGKISKIAPVYYVSGNHEAWAKNYSEIKDKIIAAGGIVLDNEAVYINRGSDKIKLIGLKDPDFETRREQSYVQGEFLRQNLAKLIDIAGYSIVLSHRPEQFSVYSEAKAGLVLSGHAHGGQFRIPFAGGVIAPNQGFFPKYTSGKYREGETDMIVSRGLGNSVIPLRINNRPQLVFITLSPGE